MLISSLFDGRGHGVRLDGADIAARRAFFKLRAGRGERIAVLHITITVYLGTEGDNRLYRI